jgi:hypothetical protein
MTYQNRTEQRGHHYSKEPSIEQVDKDLRELSDAQIDRLAADVDYSAVGSRPWENLTTADRRAWRTGEEQARRRNAAERKAKEAEQEKQNQAREQARHNAQIAEYKELARGAWIGDQASFDLAWPELLRRWQIAQVEQATDSNRARIPGCSGF